MVYEQVGGYGAAFGCRLAVLDRPGCILESEGLFTASTPYFFFKTTYRRRVGFWWAGTLNLNSH